MVIDYFGLIKSPDEDIPKPRYEQTTNISAALKAMAKRLGVPILVLCQLNRENMGRGDKTPTLSDLRDTGAIEQDADAVILLHRPEYYSDEAKKKDYIPPEREDIKLIVAKNRHGETGTVTMNWRGKTGEIDEIDVSDRELPFGKEGMNTRCHYVQGATLEEWSERTGIKLGVLYSRLYRRGWTPEEAVGLVPHKRTYKPRQLDAPVLPAVSDEDAYTRDEI